MLQEHGTDQSDKLRVLIADDDPVARQLISSRISSLACECEEAEDGIEAWHAIMSNSFDMAVVDLSMPNLDGFELLRCARSHPRTKHMPMVVITSHGDRGTIEEALSCGATSFLTKPMNWTTFSAHIDYLLKLSRTAHESRKRIRHCEATIGVKDAILSNVLTETAEKTRAIVELANSVLDRSANADSAAQATDALKSMMQAAKNLQGIVTKANHAVSTIRETVTVEEELATAGLVFDDVYEAISSTAASHDVELLFLKATENPTLRCDRRALVEAMTHLVGHAVSHSRAGQAVKVSYQIYPDSMLAFEVSDEGAGMNPDQMINVLSPRALADGVPAIARGELGLGLPISKAIAEAHGGTLELRSLPGHGTTATLTIPPERIIVMDEYAA